MTTWIKCSDQMPPDDDCEFICRNKDNSKLHTRHGMVMNIFIDNYINTNIEWTPYTKELWEELRR